MGIARDVGRHIKRQATRRATGWVSAWLHEQYFGKLPQKSNRPNSEPHERFDENRLKVPWLGKFVLRPSVLALLILVAWLPQSISGAGGGWFWILLSAVAMLWIYTRVFKWRLILMEEPYVGDLKDEDARLCIQRRIFSGARSKAGALRIAVIAFLVTVIVGLIAWMAGPSFSTVANVCWFVTLGIMVVAAITDATAYGTEVKNKYLLLRYKIVEIIDVEDEMGGHQHLELDATFRAADLPELQGFASNLGHTITKYDLLKDRLFAKLTPVSQIEAKIYDDISRTLGKPVYELAVEFTWVPNEEDDHDAWPERIDTLTFHRYPITGLFSADREKYWRSIIAAVPKGSDGWIIVDDPMEKAKTLHYGKPLTLPDSFPGAATLPNEYAPLKQILQKRDWAYVPLGMNARERLTSLNLKDVPHALYAGGTNSGKTTAIIQDMIARRSRGRSLVVIDNSEKKGGDFLYLKPHTVMFCTSHVEAATALSMLYREVRRRSRYLMENYRINNWLDTEDHDGLIAAGITPLTVYYDEYETSIAHDKERKALPVDHPDRERVRRRSLSVDYIEDKMLRLSREARAVGIFLVVATQKPLQTVLGTLRNQLGNSLQLVAGKISSSDLGLTMGSETIVAAEQVDKFSKEKRGADGKPVLDVFGNEVFMPGLGVALTSGGKPGALRVAYTPKQEGPKLLAELGVPEAEPWELFDLLHLDIDDDDERFFDRHDKRQRVRAPMWTPDDDEGAGDAVSDHESASPESKTPDMFDLFRD